MPDWLSEVLERSSAFMPHGHCYLWLPSLLWLHVISDALIGAAYVAISVLLWLLVRRMRLPFSPVFIAFGLFIGLCGLTHFMQIWTVWNPDYVWEGLLKAGTAAASVATAIGLYFVRPQVEAVVHAARLSEERRIRLESVNAELEAMYARVVQADELKSQLFANVSHELRTPLALMLGPAERLLTDDSLDARQHRQVESIHANGQMLLRQVNNLLDLARLEAREERLDLLELDAADWFRRLCAQFVDTAGQRGLRFAIDAPVALIAQFDPDKLERVVVNLLWNAMKFTPAGGAVNARLAVVDGGLQMTVDDSGPGIAVEHREAVFERFRQVDGQATRAHGGTGLGLAISRDFVAMHGGAIGIDDSSLGGARFTVTLPLRQTAQPSQRMDVAGNDRSANTELQAAISELRVDDATDGAGVPMDTDAARPDVLVVEDNVEMRRLVASTLSDCNVFTAVDGADGLERARALRPDLIVTDVMMPRVSGEQLVEAIRADADLAAVPVLLLSARTDDALRIRLLSHGAQDYLTKPFVAEELRARARNLIGAKRAGDLLRRELHSLSTDLEGLAGEVSRKNRQLQLAVEAADIAREAAEQASRAKSGFLGMISHELRTPLSTVHLNLQVLARQGLDGLPDAARARLERLGQAARQMSALVEALLEYTRIDSGRLTVDRQAFDPVALLVEIVDANADMAQPGVELRLQPSAGIPAIHSDRRLVGMIVNNLLTNALKFTSAGEVVVRIAAGDSGHVIEVEDSGPGIAQEDLARIFEPFEQLEPLRRRTIPGIGLGLALVREIAAAIGARIEVDSTLAKGSAFRIVLDNRTDTLP